MAPWGVEYRSTLEFQSYPQQKKLGSLCAKEMKLEQKVTKCPLGGTPGYPWVSSTPAPWYFKVTPKIQNLVSLSAKERKLEPKVQNAPQGVPQGTLGVRECQVPCTLELQSNTNIQNLMSLSPKERKLEQTISKCSIEGAPWG